jgi:hypothetical protein
MNGGKAPAAIRNDLRERSVQLDAKPIFNQAVKHLKVSRIEDDTRWIAIGEAHGDLYLEAAGFLGNVRHALPRFLETP